MKAKLIKTENGYGLEGVEIIAFYSSKRPVHNHYKLSKQNCDEVFGVVDVKKMGWEYYQNNGLYFHSDIAFASGLNKAMELNKDKVFTVEDMRTAMLNAIEMTDFQKEQFRKDNDYHIALDIIQSLQQPTEIEVEIITEPMNLDEIREQGRGFLNTNTDKPKLDSEGKLILKRVI
jgi:hypothetical protein